MVAVEQAVGQSAHLLAVQLEMRVVTRLHRRVAHGGAGRSVLKRGDDLAFLEGLSKLWATYPARDSIRVVVAVLELDPDRLRMRRNVGGRVRGAVAQGRFGLGGHGVGAKTPGWRWTGRHATPPAMYVSSFRATVRRL